MDFVHDTLSEGRPYRILTVVDHWSRSSPVLEARFRMSGEIVSQILDRGRWKIGPIPEVCNSISSDRANPSKMPSLSRLMGGCAMNV